MYVMHFTTSTPNALGGSMRAKLTYSYAEEMVDF